MQAILAALVDSSIFILLSWGIWRLLGRSIPLAVVPIAIGLGLAAVGGLPAQVGVPSAIGDQFGWIGVLALAFTAGLETRHGGDPAMPSPAAPGALGSSLPRFVLSAALALALPFLVGTVAAHAYFSGL